MSFIQFVTGGLFRYVDYGFRTENLLKVDDPALLENLCKLRPQKWKETVDLLSTFNDLQA